MIALASDFDGTIVFRDNDEELEGYIKPADKEAVTRLRSMGNLFGFCTGRLQDKELLSKADILQPDFYILVSGALILDKDRNIIKDFPLEYSLYSELFAKYDDKTSTGILTADDMYLVNKVRNYGTRIESLEATKNMRVYGFSMNVIDDEAAKTIATEINRDYAGKLSAYQNRHYVDVVAYGCSKGTGIDFIKKHYKLDKIAGIGDSYNDLPMLKNADVSFTFDYSNADIQNKADYVVAGVHEAVEILLKQD